MDMDQESDVVAPMTQPVSDAIARSVERLCQDEYHVRLDFHEPLLGSRPTTNIAARFVRQKEEEAAAREFRSGRRAVPGLNHRADINEAGNAAAVLLAESTAEEVDEEHEESSPLAVTGFSTHPTTGLLHLWDFQIMGMLKGVAQTLDLKIPGKRVDAISAKSQIQNLVWVFGPKSEESNIQRRLYLRRGDAYFEDADGLLDRPLRAQTARGERISIAVSEQIDPPAWVEFRILCLRGCKVQQEQIEDILSFGVYSGLGQWRSGGFGRYTYTLTQGR